MRNFNAVTTVWCDVVLRSGDTKAEYICGGAGDAVMLTGVAEFTAETCWSCVH